MKFLRQLDILNPMVVVYPVTIIGCGGIGNPTTLLLAEIGFEEINSMDPDSIEEHNSSNSLFPPSHIGEKKVYSCQKTIEYLTNLSIQAIPEKFDGCQSLSGIVVAAVDNMEARQKIWDKVKYNIDIPLLIDGRTGGETVQVFTIAPCQIEDVEFYEKHLFPDKEAVNLPCTERTIMYTGFIIAGLIGSQIKKWLNKEPYCQMLSFDLKTMTLVSILSS